MNASTHISGQPYALSQRLAQALHEAWSRPLPASIMDATTLFVLDSLGVTIGARNAPGIAAMTSALHALEPAAGPATLLTDGSKAGPATAAFASSVPWPR